VDRLQWHDRDGRLVAAGYEITRIGDGSWRLEAPGAVFRRPARAEPLFTEHGSVEEAKAWASFSESDAIRRLTAVLHLAVALAALVAFVLLANEIGSLIGLGLLCVAFYVMLRSAANGTGLFLQDAWGWTRLGPPRTSLLERGVAALGIRFRSRWLQVVEPEAASAVVPLDPYA